MNKATLLFLSLLVLALPVASSASEEKEKGGEHSAKETAKEAAAKEDDKKLVGPPIVDFDDMIINLSEPADKKTRSYLKIGMMVELAKAEDIPKVEAKKAILTDMFEVYLRELRLEDLQGSVGITRLRGELIPLIAAAVAPVEVKGLLFKDILVQ